MSWSIGGIIVSAATYDYNKRYDHWAWRSASCPTTPLVILLSTGVGRAAYYVADIPKIYLPSQMLNPTRWNLAGKCGYVWGGTAVVCWIMAFFFLPELKHRSYRQADILFNRKIAARKFKSTIIDIKDNK